MLSIATGYNPKYLTGEVAKGNENYYTREVGRGEPPGIWQGGGIAELGLSGQVDDNDMEALYVHFVDPRDPRFRGTKRDWVRARKLGRPPRTYRTAPPKNSSMRHWYANLTQNRNALRHCAGLPNAVRVNRWRSST